MTHAGARVGLIAVLVLAVVESLAAAVVYRSSLGAEDWASVREALSALPQHDPVVLVDPWLLPRARMELPRVAEPEALGRPDLHGAEMIHVLARTGFTWSNELTREIDGMAAPRRVVQRKLGAFHLDSYALARPGRVRASFGDLAGLEIRDRRGPCRGLGERRCAEGKVDARLLEVEYQPRRCLALVVNDGATLRLEYRDMPTGTELRGHVGFSNFNGVLRNDAPVRIEISIDDLPVLRMLATDEEGWKGFVVPTVTGEHDVAVSVTAAAGGQWNRRGYDPSAERTICLELRSLLVEVGDMGGTP